MSGANPNQHIIDELNRFRASKETFYGLQIDAPWGSGKTHFIKNYIADHCPQDTEENPKNIVISLFGIKSTAEIEQQIANQLFSSGERLAASAFSTLAGGMSEFFKVNKTADAVQEKSRAKALSERLKLVREGLIVFDDVERCSMKLADALGYINNFIEREGFKVVLISNESSLKRENASKEERENGDLLISFREKLIGRTLRLSADSDGAYDVFANKLSTPRAKERAIAEKKFALLVFKASKSDNLRSLRIALEAFDRLIGEVDPSILMRDDGLRDILGECIYAACEVGTAINPSLVAHPTRGRIARLMRGGRNTAADAPSDDEKASDNLVSRYSDYLNLDRPTIPFETIIDFIARGLLDKEQVKKSLTTSPLMVEPAEVPLWRRLVEIWDFDVERLEADTQEAIQAFDELRITDPGELMHLAGVLVWREKFGDLSISKGASTEIFMRQYFDNMKASGKSVELKFGVFASDIFSAYGYRVLDVDESRQPLLSIHAMMKSAMDEAAQKNYPAIVNALIEAFREKDRDLSNPLDDKSSVYLGMPLFSGSNPANFADLIMRDNKFDAHLIRWLAERYDHSVNSKVKAEEQQWLDELYAGLSRRIDQLSPLLKGWWLEILKSNLERHVTPLADKAAC